MVKARKASGPHGFYARIPEQNRRANPPRLAGQIRIFGRLIVAGGPWVGPFDEGQAATLEEHAVSAEASLTFEVVPAAECIGQRGGPELEKPAAESEDEGNPTPGPGEGAAFARTRRPKPSAEKPRRKPKAKRKTRKKK